MAVAVDHDHTVRAVAGQNGGGTSHKDIGVAAVQLQRNGTGYGAIVQLDIGTITVVHRDGCSCGAADVAGIQQQTCAIRSQCNDMLTRGHHVHMVCKKMTIFPYFKQHVHAFGCGDGMGVCIFLVVEQNIRIDGDGLCYLIICQQEYRTLLQTFQCRNGILQSGKGIACCCQLGNSTGGFRKGYIPAVLLCRIGLGSRQLNDLLRRFLNGFLSRFLNGLLSRLLLSRNRVGILRAANNAEALGIAVLAGSRQLVCHCIAASSAFVGHAAGCTAGGSFGGCFLIVMALRSSAGFTEAVAAQAAGIVDAAVFCTGRFRHSHFVAVFAGFHCKDLGRYTGQYHGKGQNQAQKTFE